MGVSEGDPLINWRYFIYRCHRIILMNTIVLDSDALIKLTKAGCLERILATIDCFISREVYEETVINL